jgi:prepilin-type N-terminal cleavage/methylation domain-containing protein
MRVPPRRPPQKGFSLLELLMVISVILITAAVAMPQIVGYVRLYRLRTAAQQVSSQLQAARAKAIMKNVNLGVLWVAQQTSSTWVIEDDMLPQTTPNWTSYTAESLSSLLGDRAQSPGWVNLPDNIVFDSPANCPGGSAASIWGLRFGRLGAFCRPGTTSCGEVPGSLPSGLTTNYVAVTAANDVIVCLLDQRTNLRRGVTVTSGGRVLIQQ